MEDAQRLFLIFIGAMLVWNMVLIRFFALCSFVGVSQRMETSIGMSLAVIFVTVMATALSWLLWKFLLTPLGIGEFLYIPSFILVIAALVQFEEMLIKKTSPLFYRAVGIYLPLITTNCAVLAIAIEGVKPGFMKLNIVYNFSFIEAVIFAFGASLGYGLAMVMFSAIRERLETAPIPAALRGYPLVFITAALMSLAFVGFGGLFGL